VPADASHALDHEAGDMLFIVYCGKMIPIVDPDSGEVREAEIFVQIAEAVQERLDKNPNVMACAVRWSRPSGLLETRAS